MKTKMFYGNQYVGSITVDGSKPKKYTWFQIQMFYAVRAFKRTMRVAAIVVIGGWIATGGMLYAKSNIVPHTVYGKEIVEVPIKEVPPVMKRIAKCESGDSHYKNGQVIFNANSNGTVDRGRYQINSVWDKKAAEMKLDLSNEKDNETFAMWIYENRGTEDWYSSKHCWQK